MHGREGAVVMIGQRYSKYTKDNSVKVRHHVSTSQQAHSRPGTKPTFTSSPKYPIYVKIIDSSGSIVSHGIDIVALRRFSFTARATLTRQNMTSKVEEAIVKYTLPSCTNDVRRKPSNEAVQAVLQWMVDNQSVPERPLPITDWEVDDSLHLKVEILSVCAALKIAPRPVDMSRNLASAIRQAPIDVFFLSHIYELLPLHHEVLVAAVQSLTHFYRFDQIDPSVNQLLEEYIVERAELLEMFNGEMERQKKLHGLFRKRQKMKRDGRRGNRAVAET